MLIQVYGYRYSTTSLIVMLFHGSRHLAKPAEMLSTGQTYFGTDLLKPADRAQGLDPIVYI